MELNQLYNRLNWTITKERKVFLFHVLQRLIYVVIEANLEKILISVCPGTHARQ